MGQYQQWLHYREVKRQLHTQIESLEAELAELEARARSFEETDASVDGDASNNELFRLLSLATRLDTHISFEEREPAATNGAASSPPTDMDEAYEAREPAAAENFSLPFFGWGLPPDFSPQEESVAAPIFEGLPPAPQPSPLPPPGIELLPEDITAFFDEHSQTDPRLELPWWQESPPVASPDMYGSAAVDELPWWQEPPPVAPPDPDMHSSAPVDQQGLRNKQEIERWIERWRRPPAQPTRPDRPDQPNSPIRPAQPKNQGERSHE